MASFVSGASLATLSWHHRFIDETPGDQQVGGHPRQVPGACWSRVIPTPTAGPYLALWSYEMGDILSLSRGEAEVLGGSVVVEGMDPYAQRYGGHQFGNWAGQLGDGRAITLGEVETKNGFLELQLKGAGRTPYSRSGDGKAVLRSSIREFLCSEAMHYLGVPTTRALSMVVTGEDVIRDMLYDGHPAAEPGAVVCRVAPSFIRFGSFEIHTLTGDGATLSSLIRHTVKHHFPNHSIEDDDGRIRWLTEVAETTAEMIAHWMRVGFVHGVMNTDNMSIHGVTIDYGPYGWVENVDLHWTPNTTDASGRRYRYGNQPHIAAWNIARFLEAVSPIMHDPHRLQEALDAYHTSYQAAQRRHWASKLGLDSFVDEDEDLVNELMSLLQRVETDMTIFFRLLNSISSPEIDHLSYAFYDGVQIPIDAWNAWLQRWWKRVNGSPDREAMMRANPKYVLRNWMAQLAIDAAQTGDYSIAEELHQLLKQPYDEQPEMETAWFQKRPEWARHRVGCSMLSCSS